jgi:hypothetical protein
MQGPGPRPQWMQGPLPPPFGTLRWGSVSVHRAWLQPAETWVWRERNEWAHARILHSVWDCLAARSELQGYDTILICSTSREFKSHYLYELAFLRLYSMVRPLCACSLLTLWNITDFIIDFFVYLLTP